MRIIKSLVSILMLLTMPIWMGPLITFVVLSSWANGREWKVTVKYTGRGIKGECWPWDPV